MFSFQAVKKEQLRALEEMKDRHQKEENKLKKNLEIEARQAETDEEARLKSEKEKQVFELQQRQAADRQARQDLHPAEMERVSMTFLKFNRNFLKLMIKCRPIVDSIFNG